MSEQVCGNVRMVDETARTVIVTGATGAMGSAAVKALAEKGLHVIMACRNQTKGEAVRERLLTGNGAIRPLQLTLMTLDLASLTSVRVFAAEVAELVGEGKIRLVGLFNNAGVMNRHFVLTADGLENTVAVNCVAPVVLTRLLLSSFEEEANVVNMVSLSCLIGHVRPDFLQAKPETFRQVQTYADSKSALLVSSVALAEHLDALGASTLHVNVADPGIVNTPILTMGRWFDKLADVVFRPLCKTPEQGVAPAIWALETDERLRYFVGKGSKPIPKRWLTHPQKDAVWSALEGWL